MLHERNDIPGAELLPDAIGIIVGYLTKKHLDSFLGFLCDMDLSAENIIKIQKTTNCGFVSSKISLSYKGVLKPNKSEYLYREAEYLRENNLAEEDLAGERLFNPSYTIEPMDICHTKEYYKVTIVSYNKTSFYEFLLESFDNGMLKVWADKFYLVQGN